MIQVDFYVVDKHSSKCGEEKFILVEDLETDHFSISSVDQLLACPVKSTLASYIGGLEAERSQPSVAGEAKSAQSRSALAPTPSPPQSPQSPPVKTCLSSSSPCYCCCSYSDLTRVRIAPLNHTSVSFSPHLPLPQIHCTVNVQV